MTQHIFPPQFNSDDLNRVTSETGFVLYFRKPEQVSFFGTGQDRDEIFFSFEELSADLLSMDVSFWFVPKAQSQTGVSEFMDALKRYFSWVMTQEHEDISGVACVWEGQEFDIIGLVAQCDDGQHFISRVTEMKEFDFNREEQYLLASTRGDGPFFGDLLARLGHDTGMAKALAGIVSNHNFIDPHGEQEEVSFELKCLWNKEENIWDTFADGGDVEPECAQAFFEALAHRTDESFWLPPPITGTGTSPFKKDPF